MLYRLEFQTSCLSLPLAHRSKLQGMIYHWLSEDPEVSGFVHDRGYSSLSGRTYKLFCFSDLRGRSFVRNRTIIFPDTVSFSLRTADPAAASVFDSVLRSGLSCVLGGQPLVLTKVQKELLSITVPKVKIKMISPLTVYSTLPPENKTVYYNPLDDLFPQQINANYHRKWESACGEPAGNDVELYPLAVGARDKCVTQIKGRYITAWGGTYVLKGTPRALEFLYHTGLGAKNSLGFGMFDILEG